MCWWLVNENILSADEVKNTLEYFSLTSKDSMQLKDGTPMLGVEVRGWQYTVMKAGKTRFQSSLLHWCNALYFPPVESWWAFSVCRWLHAVTGMIKKWTSMVTNRWNDNMKDVPLNQLVVKYWPEYAKITLPKEFSAWPEKWMYGLMLSL